MARDTEEALNALDAWDATIADPQCDEDDALEAYEEVIGVASEPARSADAVLSLAARLLTAHFAKFPHVHMNVIDVLLALSTTAQSQAVRVHTIRSLTQIVNPLTPLAPECLDRIHVAVASMAETETSGVVMRHLTALGKALNERRAAGSATATATATVSATATAASVSTDRPTAKPAPAADATPPKSKQPSEREPPAKVTTEPLPKSPLRPAPRETAELRRDRERSRHDDDERSSRRSERPGQRRSTERADRRPARDGSDLALSEESERRKRIGERPFGMPANALYCPPCPYLFIGNVPINAKQAELATFFMAVDPSLSTAHVQVKFPTRVPPSTLQITGPRAPYGYAFVGMASTDLALQAIRYVRTHPFGGRTLTAYFARGPPCPTLAFVERNRACASMEDDGAVRAIDFERDQRLWRRLCETLRPFGAFDDVGSGKVRFRSIDSAKNVIRKHYLTINGMEIIPVYEPEEQLRYDKMRTGDAEPHFALKSGRVVGDRESDRLHESSDADRRSRRGRSPSPATRRARGRSPSRSPSRGRRSRSKSPVPARGRYGSRDMSTYGPGPGQRGGDAGSLHERARPGPADRFESSRSHGPSGGGAMSRYGPASSEHQSANNGSARDDRRPSDRAGLPRDTRASPPRRRYSTVTSTSRSRSPAAARRRSPSPYQRRRSRSPGRADTGRQGRSSRDGDRSLADIAREEAERHGDDRSLADIAREEAERHGDDRSLADIAREEAERHGDDRSLADIAREEAERLDPPAPSRRDGPPPPPPGHFSRYGDGKRPEHPPPPPRGSTFRNPSSRSRSPLSRPTRLGEMRDRPASPVRDRSDRDTDSAHHRRERRESDGDRRGRRDRSPPRSAAATRYGPAPVERRRSRSRSSNNNNVRGRPDDRASRQDRSRDAASPRVDGGSDDQNSRNRANRQERISQDQRARSPPAKRGRSRSPSPVRRVARSTSRDARSSSRRVRSPEPKRSGPSRRSHSTGRVVEKKRRVESDDAVVLRDPAGAAALDDMDEMMVDYEEDD